MDIEKRLSNIEYSIKSGKRLEAASIAHDYFDSVKGRSPDNDSTIAILKVFKTHRCFQELASVSEHATRAGATAPIVYTMYAQGLLDQGLVDAGIDLLNTKKSQATTDKERSEFGGLLGRGYKQRYVNAVAQGHREEDDLRRAINSYESVYPLDVAWHGANLVALVHRAERDDIKIELGERSEILAVKVIADIIKNTQELNYWDIASIAEASLALKDWETVIARYKTFIRHKKTNAFELGSVIRQLREVWQCRSGGDDELSRILTQVEIKALSFPNGGGAVTYSAGDSRRVLQAINRTEDEVLADEFGNLEAIHGNNKQTPINVMRNLLKREDAVCRVVNRKIHPTAPSGGSGFMVKPEELFEQIPHDAIDDWTQPVLVTNNHVLSDDGRSPSVHLRFADAVFDNLGESYRVDKILWQSPREELDVCIAKLVWKDGQKKPDTLPLNREKQPLSDCSECESSEKVYVIGHPMGRGVEVSLADNLIVDHDFITPSDPDPKYHRIHYGAPTERGNSGSPVLDEYDFEVLGVHRAVAGGPLRAQKDAAPYNANEAVAIRSVRKCLRQQ